MTKTAPQALRNPGSTAVETEHYLDDQQRLRRRQHIDHLEDQITELAAHIHAATYRLLELIREYDACDGWSAPGLRSSATAPALLYLLHGPGQPLDRFPVSPSPCSRVRTG